MSLPGYLLLVSLFAGPVEGPPRIREELGRLGVDTALVLPSSALDDFPVWSPDQNFVAANVMGSVEFLRKGLSTSLVVTQRGKAPKTVWASQLETCGAPVLSSDGQFVAFLCEGNGLFVMDLRSRT